MFKSDGVHDNITIYALIDRSTDDTTIQFIKHYKINIIADLEKLYVLLYGQNQITPIIEKIFYNLQYNFNLKIKRYQKYCTCGHLFTTSTLRDTIMIGKCDNCYMSLIEKIKSEK